MSSWYYIYCLSHDPALETGIEWNSGTDNRAAAQRADSTEVPGHDGCDLVIVQSSGGPCTVSVSTKYHTRWDRVDWLRLLYAAQDAMPGPVVERLSRDWPRERLRRLRDVLDLT